MKKKVRVTIKDVARVAGVTPQTVSRAFRGTRDISEETKNRIIKIASQMGYVKNASATSLRSGSTKLIAVVYDNLMNSYFAIITHYLQERLKEAGYSMMTVSVTDTHLKENAYLSAIERNVDGIISFLQLSREIPRLVQTYHVPVLVMGRKTDAPQIDCVHVDDLEVGRIAATKLLQCGCKNPVYISEALELTCAYDRFIGFKEVFEKQGIEVSLIANKLGSSLAVEPALLELYKTNPPDAVFCFNDMIAFETLFVVEKNSLKLPKIIGVDNIQQEIYFPKRLTTVGWDKRQLAQTASDMIISRIKEGAGEGKHKTEPVFLVDGVTA